MNRITECKSVLSLIVVLLCFILQSNAQGVLSLEDCRRLAVENNKKLKIADEDVKASEAQKPRLSRSICLVLTLWACICATRKRLICYRMMPVYLSGRLVRTGSSRFVPIS